MPDRRRFPRPPLWLNLLLLVFGAAMLAYAQHHRFAVEEKSAILFKPSPSNPDELNRMREELAEMDLSRDQLAKELNGRLDYVKSLEGQEFYIAIDSAKRKLYFRIGKDVVRECDVTIGAPRTISAGGKKWTFIPLKGGFNVTGKETDYAWQIPEWVYAMNGSAQPQERPAINNAFGKYVLVLPNGYLIHSPPPSDSPMQGAKPGSFMVPEADLAAIWPRITKETRVYVF
jgi:hypothetical protein